MSPYISFKFLVFSQTEIIFEVLTKIQAIWEANNNVAERFGSSNNREKMWQNFIATCQKLTNFQVIMEQLKNELRKAIQHGMKYKGSRPSGHT